MSDSLRPHRLQQHQASLSITNSWSLLKLMSTESVMPSNHLILCHPLLPPSIFPSIRVFSMSQVFASGGQNIGVSTSTSVLPMNIQHWFPLGWTSIMNCFKITTIIKRDALDYDSKSKSLKKRNQMLFFFPNAFHKGLPEIFSSRPGSLLGSAQFQFPDFLY